MTSIWNELETDIVNTFGNHEFDWIKRELEDQILFWISSNEVILEQLAKS